MTFLRARVRPGPSRPVDTNVNRTGSVPEGSRRPSAHPAGCAWRVCRWPALSVDRCRQVLARGGRNTVIYRLNGCVPEDPVIAKHSQASSLGSDGSSTPRYKGRSGRAVLPLAASQIQQDVGLAVPGRGDGHSYSEDPRHRSKASAAGSGAGPPRAAAYCAPAASRCWPRPYRTGLDRAIRPKPASSSQSALGDCSSPGPGLAADALDRLAGRWSTVETLQPRRPAASCTGTIRKNVLIDPRATSSVRVDWGRGAWGRPLTTLPDWSSRPTALIVAGCGTASVTSASASSP